MSSLTNNTPNRISSSSNNTIFSQPSSFTNNNNNENPNTTTDTSTSSTTLGLTTMGLAAVTANNSSNTECDLKRNISSKIDDHYANFYALNRTLPPPPPPPSSTGTSPFNIINQSSQFVTNSTGLFIFFNVLYKLKILSFRSF